MISVVISVFRKGVESVDVSNEVLEWEEPSRSRKEPQ